MDEREKVAQLLDIIAQQLRDERNQWNERRVDDLLTDASQQLNVTATQVRACVVDVAVADAMADAGQMTLRQYRAARRQVRPDTRRRTKEGR